IRHGLGMAIAILATSVAGAQAPGSVLRDCADCPEVVVVPPGRFLIGAAAGEEDREGVPEPYRARSQPVTAITIARPFAIGRFPVTRAEFGAFATATGRRMEAGCFTLSFARDPPQQFEDTPDWQSPGFAQTDRHPVIC